MRWSFPRRYGWLQSFAWLQGRTRNEPDPEDHMGVTRHPLCTSRTSHKLQAIPPDEHLVRELENGWRRLPTDRIAIRFYEILFGRHPQLRPLFSQDMSAQYAKLPATIQLVVQNLRAPLIVRRALQDLGRHHAALGVRPEHYPPVIDALITAMDEVADGQWTPETRCEWLEALRLMADIMIEGGERPGSADPASGSLTVRPLPSTQTPGTRTPQPRASGRISGD